MNQFKVLKKLGEGAYAQVYLVHRYEDNKEYALKKVRLLKMDKKEVQNALNEVRLLASIKNPFVCCYKEAFIEHSSDSLCIVMEYVDGGDLHKKITDLEKE